MGKRIPAHLIVALSNWLSRGVSITAQLLSLPLLTTILSPKEFAAYAIVISLMAWYQLSDMGFGNSAQNHISEARVRNENFGLIISTVCLLGAGIFIGALILLIPASYALKFFLLNPIELNESNNLHLMLWLSGLFFVGGALGTASNKILYSIQLGVYANLVILFNSIIFLGLLWGMARFVDTNNRLFACVIAYTLPMALTGIATLTWLALRHATWKWLPIKRTFITLRPRAWRFWLFALLSAATLNVDYLIMSQTLNSTQIANYNIIFRIFWIGMALYAGLLTATWPVLSTKGAQKDYIGIERLIRLYLLVALSALFAAAFTMSAILPYIFKWLAPGISIEITKTTLFLFTLYIALRIWTDTYAAVLQALSEVNTLLFIVPIQALISITAQFLLSKEFGINGILMGLILSFCLTVAWLLPMKFKKIFNK